LKMNCPCKKGSARPTTIMYHVRMSASSIKTSRWSSGCRWKYRY
jgi:hypothetical protein